MKSVLKKLNTIIKTNKSIIKKQNDIECHLNRSVSMKDPNGLDALIFLVDMQTLFARYFCYHKIDMFSLRSNSM